MSGIAPGDYKVFSWDSVEEADEPYAEDWYDAEWLKLYESKGQSIHLDEADQKSVNLTLIGNARGCCCIELAHENTLMKILLFGASGTVGNSVLDTCIAAAIVDEIRAITRRPLMNTGAKLRTFVHKDFLDYSTVQEAFRAVDACLFCLGTSVTQVSKEDYRKISYSMPLAAAQMLKSQSPGAAFHYISGKGTDLKSRMLWSRVKGQAEQDLIELIDADCWRPAFIDAKPSSAMPKYYSLVFRLGRLFKTFPSMYVHGHDLAKAMLQATKENLRRRIIENREIHRIAARASW